MHGRWQRGQEGEHGIMASCSHCHCGLVVSAPAWDGTGCEFDSWLSDIYPMFIEPTITWVPSGFSGYIWLDTKIV